jgi:hypothetical protein
LSRWKLVGLAFSLLLVLTAVALPLRQMEASGRVRALAHAVSAGDHVAAEALLARGVDPNTLVAWRPSALASMLAGYRSLLLIANERGDTRMAQLLRSHGAVSRLDSAPRPGWMNALQESGNSRNQKSPWLQLWERWAWRYTRVHGSRKVDLQDESRVVGSVLPLMPAFLILVGSLRMLGVGLPRSAVADPKQVRRALAQGAVLLLLGTILAAFVAWLVS